MRFAGYDRWKVARRTDVILRQLSSIGNCRVWATTDALVVLAGGEDPA